MAVTRRCCNMFQGVVIGVDVDVNVDVVVICGFMEPRAKNIENMNKIEVVVLIF